MPALPDVQSVTTPPDHEPPAADLSPSDFDALYRDQWPKVLNYLRFKIGPADAADVASEVFARAWDRRHTFDAQLGPPSVWVWGIVRHAAVDHYRRPRPTTSTLPNGIDGQRDLSVTVEQREQVAELLAAVGRLAAEDRELLALRFGAGLGNQAAARALGLSDSNAAVRLHRALRRLRHLLTTEGDLP